MSDGDPAKLARRTLWAGVACAVAVAVAAVAVWTQRPQLAPIEVSQQTTYIITPTRADGWVDYPEAVDWMRRAGLDAGGGNAALPLLHALGRDVLPVGADRGAVLKRLGPAAGQAAPDEASDATSVFKPLGRFTGPDAPGPEPPAAVSRWLRARCGVAPQKQVSFGRIVAWLGQSEGALADLRAAAQGASLYVPVSRASHPTGGFDRVNPPLLGEAADALACHAALKLLQGDAAASWADVDAAWRLGQLLARAASLNEYSLALELWRRALAGTVDLAASPAAGPDLLSAIQAALGAKLGFPPATEAWMFHRLSVIEANGTPRVAQPKSGPPTGGPMARPGTAALLEAINAEFDAVDVALQTPDPKQRIARVDQLALKTAAPVGITGRSVLGVEIQAVSYHRLGSIAVALARRQRDGGKLPASLADLGPLPADPGSGGSFGYSPDGRQFRLHGVGADGRDDGGDPARDAVALVHEPPRLGPP
jgi:hypothetical protein